MTILWSQTGIPLIFIGIYLSPFIVGFTQAIRSVMPEAGIFFEGSPERIS